MPIQPRQFNGTILVRNYSYHGAGDYVTTFVDLCDGWLMQHAWHTIKGGYVASPLDGKTTLMHRCILITAYEVDHIDRDKLNNRRINLRPSNRSDNTHNTAPRGRSDYKGVFQQSKGSWAAKINIDGIQTHLGSFPSPEEAADAYNIVALQVYGPTAFQNSV